ncbi:mage family protein [Lichtheimia corymbifera JMRC:FSU:9682]|uniref:Mage family protein n=1 Tax=Lichtheimia corymbifera JMRC:FSU:9682 TaxID=1263082 RepID=A0A068RSJ5_9FUNG|nr:mage family protein [Lichtheimia corymbifera JMRC:FSU:9682]
MSQSQKRKSRAIHDDSDDDYSGPASQRPKAEHTINWDNETLSRKVKDTVRYALACEYRRQPIRRDDINKKVLQERTREFKQVHAAAQRKLKHLFGMEMVEMGQREKPSVKGKAKDENAKPVTTRSYILRSILDNKYNEPELIKRKDEDYESMGILYVILALIFTNERAMHDVNLKEHLDRLNIHDDGSKFGDREKLLDGFVKQGYLHRAKVGDEARGNNDNVWEYYWGPRARAEILDSNIVDFIISFFGEENVDVEDLSANIFKASGVTD